MSGVYALFHVFMPISMQRNSMCCQFVYTASSRMHRITKIGEGAYTEVFSAYTDEGEEIIIKVNIRY